MLHQRPATRLWRAVVLTVFLVILSVLSRMVIGH